jgi:hypothetical protein
MIDELVQLGYFQRCPRSGQALWRGKESGTPNPSASPGTTNSRHEVRGRLQPVDHGIFLMEFAVFVECFPITTMVGPITRHQTEECSESQTLKKTRANQPNCIYKSTPVQLSFVETALR